MQRRINSACRAHPRSYQYFTNDTWQSSLTGAQKRYIDRMCPGGEDQPSSDLCGDNTPLVVAFDSEPIRFTSNGSAFDSPTATTPWVVLDRNGNGAIDGGAELFGSGTALPNGSNARNGFLALAVLDANHDDVIDAHDPAFTSLQLWADDGDQRSTPGELRALADTVVSISLASHVEMRCDARDNSEGDRAALTWRDERGVHTGSVVDVYLPRR